jgi:hypothetical protein
MILYSRLSATESSRCWTFFYKYIARSVGPCGLVESDFALEKGLSRLLSSLSQFTHNVRPASELWAYYTTVTFMVHDQAYLFVGIHGTFAAHCSNLETSICDKDVSNKIRSFLRLMRSYCLSITLALVMNTILRVYHQEKDSLLAQDSEKFISGLISMATQAVPLQPLGTGFMVPFLNTAWSVIYRASPGKMEDTINMHDINPVIDRRIVFSCKLNKSLDALQTLVNEQLSFSADTHPRMGIPAASLKSSRPETKKSTTIIGRILGP